MDVATPASDGPFAPLELRLGRRKQEWTAREVPAGGRAPAAPREAPEELEELLAVLARPGPLVVSLVASPQLLPLARQLEGLAMAAPPARFQLHVAEPLGDPSRVRPERLLVELRRAGEEPAPRLQRHVAAGVPTLRIRFDRAGQETTEQRRWLGALRGASAFAERPEPEPRTEAPERPPALREGPLALYAAPDHAARLAQIAGTLGAGARASIPHWLAAQLALGAAGDLASIAVDTAQAGEVEAALTGLQQAIRDATGLPVRARIGLDLAALHPQRAGGGPAALQFLLASERPGNPAPEARARRWAILDRLGEVGRRALLLVDEEAGEERTEARPFAALREAAGLLTA
jgi:hypothetical protein